MDIDSEITVLCELIRNSELSNDVKQRAIIILCQNLKSKNCAQTVKHYNKGTRPDGLN